MQINDFINGGLSVFILYLFLRLSSSHGCSQVLQWWSREWESLAEGSQALPTAVNHHWAVLQRWADRWASNGCRCRGFGLRSNWVEYEMYKLALCCLKIFHTPSVFSTYPFCLSAAGCESLSAEQKEVLLWLFRPPLQTEPLSEKPKLTEGSGEKLVEIGPRYRIF